MFVHIHIHIQIHAYLHPIDNKALCTSRSHTSHHSQAPSSPTSYTDNSTLTYTHIDQKKSEFIYVYMLTIEITIPYCSILTLSFFLFTYEYHYIQINTKHMHKDIHTYQKWTKNYISLSISYHVHKPVFNNCRRYYCLWYINIKHFCTKKCEI